MEFPQNAPRIVTAGDTVSFDIGMSGYPPDEWSMQFVILSDTPVAFVGNVLGDSFAIDLSPADSSTIPPGRWGFSYVFTKTATGERVTYGPWPIVVKPDPLLPRTPTWAQARLAEVNMAISKLTGRTTKSVSVDGQTYTFRDMDELLRGRNELLVLVNNELRALGLIRTGGSRTIVTRFVS